MGDRPVVYVGPFSFPWGEAASRRVLGVAATIASTGRQVTVIPGRGMVGEVDVPDGLRDRISVVHGVDEFAGGRLRRSWAWLAGQGSRTRVALADLPTPSHVIVYGGNFPYLRNLAPWCRDREVPLLLDMVEWYDPRSFPGGPRGPIARGDRFSRARMHPRAQGVIAISTLLRDHYAGLGLPVALVPPTVVTQPPARQLPAPTPVRVCYAGTPGAKDELGLMLRAFQRVRRTKENLEFVIAGPSPDEVAALLGGDLTPGIQVLGRVRQDEIAALLASVHFTLLLRQQKLSSNAGFPTKVVESMVAGVPVIGNLTSDLGTYLMDGVTGFVADPDVDSLASALERAASMSKEGYEGMSAATTRTAADFWYGNYTDAMDSLLDVSSFKEASASSKR